MNNIKMMAVLENRDSVQSLEDYKIEKVLQRKSLNEDFQLKKSIFLLNRQEILKDYVSILIIISNIIERKSFKVS